MVPSIFTLMVYGKYKLEGTNINLHMLVAVSMKCVVWLKSGHE